MRQRRTLAAALVLALAAATPAAAQSWRVHAGTGTALNLPLPMKIEQAGYPDLSFTAHWDTHPFDTPLYYLWRVERAYRDGWLGLELIHHKIFLTNPPPSDVQSFSITHGFNVLTVQRVWERADGFSYRAGAGVIVAHPEGTIRSRPQPKGGWGDRGYYLSGPALQGGAGWSRAIARKTRLGLEAKAIAAHASVPIALGHARVWNASGHLDATVSRAF